MTIRHYMDREVELSNENKVLFPGNGLTKVDVVDYYERLADHILPHLEGRPLVLQRFPDGIEGHGFYQKQAGEHLPGWVRTVNVQLTGSKDSQDLVVCDDVATLVYLANQACLVLHPWLSPADALEHPDLLVVDLDPSPGNDFESVRQTARKVRALFEELGLPSFLKLTGSKGVHIAVPLDGRADFDTVRSFARDAMQLLAERHPDDLTTEQRKDQRRGRVYLDVGRNAYGQTAVAPYSVRPLHEAPVAAPIDWDELGRVGPHHVTVKNVFRRLAQREDPWHGLRRRAHSLQGPAERLRGMKRP
jgi:bifunctional non-homologous end joining protein LigD